MRIGGKGQIGLLAVLGMLALPSAAAASTTFTVNSETDAPLEGGASTCESTDVAKDCTLLAAVELADTVSRRKRQEQVAVEVPKASMKTRSAPRARCASKSTRSVAINGAGAGKTIIDGGGVESRDQVGMSARCCSRGSPSSTAAKTKAAGSTSAFEAELIVENSAIEHNEAEDGGGIYGDYFAYIALINSTVAHNSASEEGGACTAARSATSSSAARRSKKTRRTEGGGGGIFTLLLSEHGLKKTASGRKQARTPGPTSRRPSRPKKTNTPSSKCSTRRSTTTRPHGAAASTPAQIQNFCPLAKAAKSSRRPRIGGRRPAS